MEIVDNNSTFCYRKEIKKTIVSFASLDQMIAYLFLSPREKDDREYVGYSQNDKSKDDNRG
jgi:hypothetical protein